MSNGNSSLDFDKMGPEKVRVLVDRPATDYNIKMAGAAWLQAYNDREQAKRNSATRRAEIAAWSAVGFAVIAILISLAAWLNPRSPAEPIRATVVQAPRQSKKAIIAKAARAPAISYPQYATSVPVAFRGRWDEIVADKCAAREARFEIGAASLKNFEVVQDVERVKLYSPIEIAITTSFYDDEKNEQNGTWEFRLVDDGKTLTGRKASASLFHKCPPE